VKISVVSPAELGAAEIDRWRQLQATDFRLQSPFLSPEFTIAVGRARPAARVAILQDGSSVVGFFPYELRQRVVGRPIGFGLSDCQGLVHAPGLDWDPMELLRACKLPVWEFDHLIADQAPFAPYQTEQTGSPILDLSGGYQAYVDASVKAGDVIKKTLRQERVLGRDVGETRFVWDDRDAAALAALKGWKSAQYQRTQQYDRFATPWIAQVIQDLLDSPEPSCRAFLSVLYAGDQPVAAHLGLRSSTVLAYWFPSYDPEHAKYSAGIVICLRSAEAGAADGIDYMDLGKSPGAYKDRLKNGELMVASGRVDRSWSVGTMRRTQSALIASARTGRVGQVLKSGRTGQVLRKVRSRLANKDNG
jgi:CelD/BcsL family acetyltransferase involved in cellulose biosynthesis